jgi:GNAT superfamily N-acetyltransferase
VDLVIRRATLTELDAILDLYRDDPLALHPPRAADRPTLDSAFRSIEADPRTAIYVATRGGAVVGTFQSTILQHLTHGGARVVQIEAVVVSSSERGRGVGTTMMQWALEEARAKGCTRAQLTSQKRREDAHRFYQRLGFVPSQEGMKKEL